MPRADHKLSARRVATLIRPGRYGDGNGLWLQITKAGVKSWLFRYTVDGKAFGMGLGPLHTYGLAEARERARLARQQLDNARKPIEPGKPALHPLASRRAAEATAKAAAQEAAGAKTFGQCAEAYVKAHQDSWRNPKHRAQWRATLGLPPEPGERRKSKRGRKASCPSVIAIIGDLPVASIDTARVMHCIQPLWDAGLHETATRVRGRIERVLDWAKVRGYRQGENPARWRGHLQELLGKRKRPVHQPAMPYAGVPGFMAELRAQADTSARALEFCVLTATRTGETIGALWDEIDASGEIWRIPDHRTKSGRPHDVPLSPRALQILEELPRQVSNPYVFAGAIEGRPLSDMAMLEKLRGMRPDSDLVVHGFRSSFRDWAGDCTHFPREVIEAALAHVVKDKTEAAYRRSDAIEKRRQLMGKWDDYCHSPPKVAANNVVPINAGAAA